MGSKKQESQDKKVSVGPLMHRMIDKKKKESLKKRKKSAAPSDNTKTNKPIREINPSSNKRKTTQENRTSTEVRSFGDTQYEAPSFVDVPTVEDLVKLPRDRQIETLTSILVQSGMSENEAQERSIEAVKNYEQKKNDIQREQVSKEYAPRQNGGLANLEANFNSSIVGKLINPLFADRWAGAVNSYDANASLPLNLINMAYGYYTAPFNVEAPYRGSMEDARKLGYRTYYDPATNTSGEVDYGGFDRYGLNSAQIAQEQLKRYGITEELARDKSPMGKLLYETVPAYSYDPTMFVSNLLTGTRLFDADTGLYTGETSKGSLLDYGKIEGRLRFAGLEPDYRPSPLRQDQRNLAFGYPIHNNTMHVRNNTTNFAGNPYRLGYAFDYTGNQHGNLGITSNATVSTPSFNNITLKALASGIPILGDLVPISEEDRRSFAEQNNTKTKAANLKPGERTIVQDYGPGAGGRGRFTVGRMDDGTLFGYDWWDLGAFGTNIMNHYTSGYDIETRKK